MNRVRPQSRSSRPAWSRAAVLVAVLAVFGAGAVLAVPALGHQTNRIKATQSVRGLRTAVRARDAVDKRAARTATASSSAAGLANLPRKAAKMSCAQLVASTHSVNGLQVQITASQVGSATAGGPQYCALTGHIANDIGFEVLLPTTTWHQRYLQVGCGGLCGNIGLNAPQTTNFKALANGYFVVAAQDEGHSGQSNAWYSNPTQRVDFAYLSDHDLAVVSKGLAQKFYGLGPKYSYFDGCSQGGHQALAEAQRYPKDFNGILAGAPATIMTELNSVLHEYEYKAVESSSGQSLLSETQANIVLQAAIKRCNPKLGLILDTQACEQKFKLSSVACTATKTSNCLTAVQIAAVRRVLAGPVDPQGQKLYPDGYSLASAWDWDNGTGPNIPATEGATVMPATFITAWLQYFAFEKDIGTAAVANEPFTKSYFEKIERLAPFWDDTNPYLQPFDKAGGKLILWQGGGDWSIPTASSLAYYQAVVKANGGIASTKQFARYYQLPSVGHCGGGTAPDSYPGLKDVARWVETGTKPNAIEAREYTPTPMTGGGGPPGGGGSTSDLTDAIPTLGAPGNYPVVRTINLYPYPKLPSYKGHGSVDKASSYVGKVSKAMETPLTSLVPFNNKMIWCNSEGVACKTRLMPTS